MRNHYSAKYESDLIEIRTGDRRMPPVMPLPKSRGNPPIPPGFEEDKNLEILKQMMEEVTDNIFYMYYTNTHEYYRYSQDRTYWDGFEKWRKNKDKEMGELHSIFRWNLGELFIYTLGEKEARLAIEAMKKYILAQNIDPRAPESSIIARVVYYSCVYIGMIAKEAINPKKEKFLKDLNRSLMDIYEENKREFNPSNENPITVRSYEEEVLIETLKTFKGVNLDVYMENE